MPVWTWPSPTNCAVPDAHPFFYISATPCTLNVLTVRVANNATLIGDAAWRCGIVLWARSGSAGVRKCDRREVNSGRVERTNAGAPLTFLSNSSINLFVTALNTHLLNATTFISPARIHKRLIVLANMRDAAAMPTPLNWLLASGFERAVRMRTRRTCFLQSRSRMGQG